MRDFTFVALTYNQADYILPHLESIRYQTETWGDGRAVHLILSDDCSQDETVPLARAWLRGHTGLFSSVRILTAEQNQGIVQNYLRALRAVETERFKILAGDDLYYKNDLFAAAQAGDFVMSPILYFQDGRVLPNQYLLRHWVFQEFVRHEGKDLKQLLRKRQGVTNCVYTPGVFYRKSLADAQTQALLKGRRWMEDYPLWNYLLAREDLEPTVICQPVVLYRAGGGISTGARHKSHSGYEQERLAFLREIGSPFAKYPWRLNPYRYAYYARYFAKGMAYTLFVQRWDARVNNFLRTMQCEEQEAGRYLGMLSERSNAWNQTYRQDGG